MMSDINPLVLEKIPQADTCLSALELARDALPIPILNHSLRVYLLARYIAEKEASPFKSEDQSPLLFVAAIHHDIGASHLCNGEQRFEICSADCAKAHLAKSGYSEAASHQVWTAIAVHTSPGIAERIDPLSRLIRLGVLSDFGSKDYRTSLGVDEYYTEIEKLLPRLDAEKCLGDAVVSQAKEIPHVDSLGQMTPSSLLRAGLGYSYGHMPRTQGMTASIQLSETRQRSRLTGDIIVVGSEIGGVTLF